MITLRMWQNLARMGEHYAGLGFQDLPLPWVASSQAVHVTLPMDTLPTEINDGQDILIGSAEQAFIDCMLTTKRISVGKWQAITPCFRNEPVYDRLHRPYFMKLELIHYMPDNAEQALDSMVQQAYQGFVSLLPSGEPKILVEPTGIGWDLLLRGQELGSYGIREYEGHQWVYGTGLAEPRFTTLLAW